MLAEDQRLGSSREPVGPPGFGRALDAEAGRGFKVTAVIAGAMRPPSLLDRFPNLDPNVHQDSANEADTIHDVLARPDETASPEVLGIPMRELSWP